MDGLVSVLIGDGCLFFVGGDVFCVCMCVCACGCEGTTGCGGVFLDGVFVVFSESIGVHCLQGSKLSGEDSVFCCLFVCCELTGCGDAGTIG